MNIAVIGSINVDLIYQVNKMPLKGETIFGNNYQILDGGKGANQAVILNALEDNVTFFGAVGSDSFGDLARNNIFSKGVNGNVLTKHTNTGIALIQIANSDNSIIVFKGANDMINKNDIDKFFQDNEKIDIIVSQLEINIEAIKYMIEEAYKRNIMVILNPAPANKLDKKIIDMVTYLIPNETEAEAIYGTNDLNKIVSDNKGKVIITLGKDGVMYYDGNVPKIVPAQVLEVVDTTGAGDSFIAGFTSGIAKNLTLKDAIIKGINVASETCKHMGAQSSYKTIKEWK